MDLWTAMLDVLILLAAAMVLGAVCERLRQNAIVGYLLAGTLLGPNALDLMPSHREVQSISELGVALLLFTIGLEFSWQRLRRLGTAALGGGSLQVVGTGIVFATGGALLGLSPAAAVALGAAVALSSTACVLRVLGDRTELDSVHGRNALGILLLQDMAVVPLVLLVTILGGSGSAGEVLLRLAGALGAAVGLVIALYLVFRYLVPRLLAAGPWVRNRELPILLAVVTAIGAATAAHALNLSPALGAFVAGLVLAESPFATQIRADVRSLRVVFVTLFFAAVGMLGDPGWVLAHWPAVAAMTAAVVLGKALITGGLLRLVGIPTGSAVATGLSLAQIGEFSFMLVAVASQGDLIGADLFNLLVSVTIVTLLLTPHLIAVAVPLATALNSRLCRGPLDATPAEPLAGHVVVVGYGPAGGVADVLLAAEPSWPVHVVELNPEMAAVARRKGMPVLVGDARQIDVLEHVHVATAAVVVVTVPDPATAVGVIAAVRSLAPRALVVARARYHRHRHRLLRAGADHLVDEESEVAHHLADAVRKAMGRAT